MALLVTLFLVLVNIFNNVTTNTPKVTKRIVFLTMPLSCAGIFKQSMGARNQVGIELSYRPARLHRLAELVPWSRFLGSLKVKKFGLCFSLGANLFF